jgi:MoaA/NifB/PqqE/SkfB family radical SAM enzyme
MRYKNKRVTLEDTIENIRAFQAALTPEDCKGIILHMVANTGNFREIAALARIAADLEIRSIEIGNYICADRAHLDKTLWNVKQEYNEEVKKAIEVGGKLGVTVNARKFFTGGAEVKGADACMQPFEQFFIETPGTSVPCCFMGTLRMGNVYKDGFESVWFSEVMHSLRKRRSLPPCQVCTVFTPFDSKIAHMSAFLTTASA